MSKNISKEKRAYIAGFIDGDGSIYVRLKPSKEYRYGYQIAPYIILFQSNKERKNFEKICNMLNFGYIRERKDGILEYTINRKNSIMELICMIEPYIVLKKKQIFLMKRILIAKEKVKTKNDFARLMKLVDQFRELNYSKKRKRHKLTP